MFSSMSNNAKIINSNSENVTTKILWIEFSKEEDLKALFTPNLANIGFVFFGKTVSVRLKSVEFRDYFNDWVERFLLKLESAEKIEKLIDIFNNEIKALILLGQKEEKLSMTSARGLYGELLVLLSYLNDNIMSEQEILEGWHRPSPSNHDFVYDSDILEVKTISRSNTTLKITSEDQLTTFENKELKLKVFRIEDVQRSKIDSLGELYNKIKSKLNKLSVNTFEIKCAEDVFCKYLGPERMPLDYKFILIEEFLFIVDQINFPRIRKEHLDNGISGVSYNLDLSSINNFKIK
jgi:hypothetical protein